MQPERTGKRHVASSEAASRLAWLAGGRMQVITGPNNSGKVWRLFCCSVSRVPLKSHRDWPSCSPCTSSKSALSCTLRTAVSQFSLRSLLRPHSLGHAQARLCLPSRQPWASATPSSPASATSSERAWFARAGLLTLVTCVLSSVTSSLSTFSSDASQMSFMLRHCSERYASPRVRPQESCLPCLMCWRACVVTGACC